MPAADGGRRHHQPSAARRPHGIRAFARRDLDRAAAKRRCIAAQGAVVVHAQYWGVVNYCVALRATVEKNCRLCAAPRVSTARLKLSTGGGQVPTGNLYPRSRRETGHDAGWSSPVARQAHNLKVLGSNPSPATPWNAVDPVVVAGFICFRTFALPLAAASIAAKSPSTSTRILSGASSSGVSLIRSIMDRRIPDASSWTDGSVNAVSSCFTLRRYRSAIDGCSRRFGGEAAVTECDS